MSTTAIEGSACPGEAARSLVGPLVERARSGDPAAWDALIARLGPLVAAVARRCGVRAADVPDVVQTTWLRLFEHLGQLREPASAPGWLVVTARRESWRALAEHARVDLVGDLAGAGEVDDTAVDVEAADARRVVRQAVGRLPERHRALLEALVWQDLPYPRAAQLLGLPVGSLGPTRQRTCRRLAHDPGILALR